MDEINDKSKIPSGGRSTAVDEPTVSRTPRTVIVRQRTPVRPLLYVAAALTLLIGGWQLTRSWHQNDGAVRGTAGKDRAVPVSIAIAKTEVMPVEVRTIGNVLPYSVVNVVPQVNGQLTNVYFTQGQFVKKGQLLFQIDPRPYQAALDQALGNVAKDQAAVQQAQATMAKDIAQVGQLQANLKRDLASARYAHVEKNRYNSLLNEGAVSREQTEQMGTNAATAQATTEADQKAIENAQAVVNADKAAIATAKGTLAADEAVAENARINLGFCQIHSPIDGRTGSLNVYQGNVVSSTSNTALVTIAQVQPIYVTFTVPEQYLDQVRQNLEHKSLAVNILVEGQKANPVNGQVSFMQNTIDTSTGTVTMRASFPNTSNKLFPGQFVDVVLTMPASGPTIVVPTAALQQSQQGTAVYVLGQDDTAAFVPVKVLRTHNGMAAVSGAVQAGARVVTDGQLQLTPGAKTRVNSNRAPRTGS